MTTYQAAFHHAGKTYLATIRAGWFTIRLPGSHQPLSVLVTHNDLENRNAVLISNVLIRSEADALQLYADWRLRGKIEHGYRFDQEQAWISKTCACRSSKACAAPLLWCWLRLSSSFTSCIIGP
jgi:hypothetical protein